MRKHRHIEGAVCNFKKRCQDVLPQTESACQEVKDLEEMCRQKGGYFPDCNPSVSTCYPAKNSPALKMSGYHADPTFSCPSENLYQFILEASKTDQPHTVMFINKLKNKVSSVMGMLRRMTRQATLETAASMESYWRSEILLFHLRIWCYPGSPKRERREIIANKTVCKSWGGIDLKTLATSV